MPTRTTTLRRRLAVVAARAMLVAALLPAVCVAQDAPPQRPGCIDQRHRQFDFWLGEWEVFLPDGSKAGENRIERIAAGCALQESWVGRGGFSGSSLNIFDRNDGRWHQIWVDSSGGRLALSGALADASMILSSTLPHPTKQNVSVTQRITWTPGNDGSVRQLWETSEDGGKTWTTAFDGRYVRKKP